MVQAADWTGELGPGAVIYQIYPRSFLDTTGDGIGDLRGIMRKLPHVAGLGVDAVWLSPVFASPMADFGYDVADYCAIDPIFGTMEDFDALVAEAHRLGLKLILDQVYCHTSDRHPWLNASRSSRDGPKADWYVWADPKADGIAPNNWLSVFYGPAWSWNARRGQYYLHNFLPEQPQLNVHNADVQDALLEVARFWFARGVDGFRLDAINFLMHGPSLADNPPAMASPGARPFDRQRHLHNQSQPGVASFLKRLRAVADGFGGRFLLAETPGERAREEMALYIDQGGVDTAYGFHFLYAEKLDADLVRRGVGGWGERWPTLAFSNHDAPRAVSRWAGECDQAAFAKLLLLLQVCLRGYVCLYQGEELGLPQGEMAFERLRDPEAIRNWPRSFGRDGARTPMPWTLDAAHAGFSTTEPWLPVDGRHVALAVDAQESDADSVLHFARRALALRKNDPVLRRGELSFLGEDGDLLAFERVWLGERRLCLFNLGAAPVETGFAPSAWRILLANGDRSVDGQAPARLEPWDGFVAAPA